MAEERRFNMTDREREGRHVETIERMANEKEELIVEVRRLEAALRKYGCHVEYCQSVMNAASKARCSCGLDAALEGR